MPCLTNEAHFKLPSMHRKSLPSLIRNCVSIPSDLSSEDENTYYDLDTKHMVLKELRSRASRSRPTSKVQFYSADLTWSLLEPPVENTHDHLEFQDPTDNDDETEAFFSVRSNFSHCSSQGASASWDGNKGTAAYKSVLEEFKHLEGWPFGLCRRPVLLPPLPSMPADSWMWRLRKSEAKSAGVVN